MCVFLIKSLIFSVIILGFVFVNVEQSEAIAVDQSCTDVEVIFARGSGDKLGEKGMEASRFFRNLTTEFFRRVFL